MRFPAHIIPAEQARILRELEAYHTRKAAEATDPEERADRLSAAAGCRRGAVLWEEEVAKMEAKESRPATSGFPPKVEAPSCKANPVASHAAPNPPPKSKPAPSQPLKVAAGQGSLF